MGACLIKKPTFDREREKGLLRPLLSVVGCCLSELVIADLPRRGTRGAGCISAQCGSPPPRNPVGHLQILCQIRSDLGEERPLSKHCGTGSFLAIRRVGFWIRSCLLVGSSMINSCTRSTAGVQQQKVNRERVLHNGLFFWSSARTVRY